MAFLVVLNLAAKARVGQAFSSRQPPLKSDLLESVSDLEIE
jgi:hypothetical protein